MGQKYSQMKDKEQSSIPFTSILKSTADQVIERDRENLLKFFEKQNLFFDMEKFIVAYCEHCLKGAKLGKRAFTLSLSFRRNLERNNDLEMQKQLGLNDYIGVWKQVSKNKTFFLCVLFF